MTKNTKNTDSLSSIVEKAVKAAGKSASKAIDKAVDKAVDEAVKIADAPKTKEVKKIEEFAIVIDTSMSCSGELVQKFLEETYSVLKENESFFKKINVHIIQCDEQVHSDCKITSEEELKEYMEHMELYGQGGTDFRPAFEYVEQLVREKEFHDLRGLIYFTDGYGIYPNRMPPFKTAFVFMQEDYTDVDVPVWAIKLILSEDELG